MTRQVAGFSDAGEITTALLAEDINVLGRFCGVRDVEKLSAECLQSVYGMSQADVMVLFGGSILCGGDVLAQAMQSKIAKKYVIVGGAGHTTEALRQRVHEECPFVMTEGMPEAEVFQQYIKHQYGLQADFLECESTNCGNNITYLLDLLRKNELAFQSIILCQDATMQRRMAAGLRKYVPEEVQIINYAAYMAQVISQNDALAYASDICGMWDMDRYVNLLMGEIPRLRDDNTGYGPKGKDFIAHVDIPEAVLRAFEQLKGKYGEQTREANPLYASQS